MELFEIFYNSCAVGMISFLVPKEDLAIATSVSSFDDGIVNVAGPIFAAFLYSKFNLGTGVMVAVILSALAVILLFIMKFSSHQDKDIVRKKSTFKQDLIDGIKIARSNKIMKKMIILAPLINFFLAPLFNITLTYMLRNELNASDFVFANYQSLLAVVSILAPIFAMKIVQKTDAFKLLSSGLLVISFSFLILTAGNMLSYYNRIQNAPTYIILFIGSSICIAIVILMNISISILFQQVVPKEYYSRIGALGSLFSTVSVPIGQMVYGSLLEVFPSYVTFFLSIGGTIIIYFLSKSMLKNASEDMNEEMKEENDAPVEEISEGLDEVVLPLEVDNLSVDNLSTDVVSEDVLSTEILLSEEILTDDTNDVELAATVDDQASIEEEQDYEKPE